MAPMHKPAGHGAKLYPAFYRLMRELRPAVVHTRKLAALVDGPGGHFEAIWHARLVDDQRVIARSLEGIGQPAENPDAAVMDHGGLAVHDAPGAHDATAEHLADTLMPQADAEDGHDTGKMLDGSHGHASLVGGAGAGRDHEALGPQLLDLLH